MIKTVRAAVDLVAEDARQTTAHPAEGEAQIAETVYGVRRLVVRRSRLTGSTPSCGRTCATLRRARQLPEAGGLGLLRAREPAASVVAAPRFRRTGHGQR